MTTAALDGNAVRRLNLQVPAYGVWWADVELVGEVSLSGAVTLTLAGETASGTVKAGGVVRGRSRYRVAGGAGAWSDTIATLAYSNDAGVKRTSIAQDAATACGETVDTSGLSGTVGPAYVRPSGRASHALDYVAPQAWYVDLDGTTYFGARTTTTLTTTATRTRIEPDLGLIELAPADGDMASLVPGVIVDGVTALDVRHTLDESGLRTTIWGTGAGASRRREAMRRMIRAACPELRWSGVYEYRVVQQFGERIDVQPVLSSLGLPAISRVRVRPGVPGVSATHAPGALVLVGFVNSDPARPVVVGFDDADSPGFLPDGLSVDSEGDVEIGASSDMVELGSGSETLTTPLEVGRVIRYGDPVVFTGSPSPMTTGGAYVFTCGVGASVSKVKA